MPRRCARLLAAYAAKHRRHTASVTASSMPATMFFSTPRPGATAPWRFHRPIRGSNTVTCWRTITVFGRSTADDETNYLFIVGGADVIPMPVLPQYISDPDYSDTDIDSDIPYAYLLGERTYPMLGTAEIFQYEQYFHTGRLPLAHDASLDDLAGYLRARGQSPRFDGRGQGLRADRSHVAFGLGFGQRAFPPQSTLPGRRAGSMSVSIRRTFVSPCVERSIVDKVFDRGGLLLFQPARQRCPRPHAASMLPTSSNVTRQSRPGSWRPPRNRTVVTEACYGGKFQDYGRGETMLLAAMGDMTLLYLGSSRIAWVLEEQFGSRPGQCRPPDERLYGQIARGVYGRRGILHGTAELL